MKVMINKKNSRKLAIAIAIMLTATTGFGQGLLADGAIKTFHWLKEAMPQTNQNLYRYTSYNGEAANAHETYNLYNLTPVVLESFSVNSVEIIFENEISRESWMGNLFYDSSDPAFEVEEWMTVPIYRNDSVEGEVKVESWMKKCFQ